jgi:hypothetical protein
MDPLFALATKMVVSTFTLFRVRIIKSSSQERFDV